MHKYFMKSAIHQVPLEIIYQSKNGNFSKRVIIVRKINEHTILAYCLTKKQYRTFAIDRIFAVRPVRKKDGFQTA